MLEQLMKRLGWVRTTSTAPFSVELAEARSRASQADYKARMLRSEVDRLDRMLRDALRPRVAPFMKAYMHKAVMTQHEEHLSMYKVYALRLPAIDLNATDEWYPHSSEPLRMQEYIMQVWVDEFERILPDVVRQLAFAR